jgi:hypothetical protein
MIKVNFSHVKGRVMAQAVAGFTPRKAGFNPRSVHVRFVVLEVAL